MSTPALAGPALALLVLLHAPAAAAEGPADPAAVETDDEALQAIQRAVRARDAEALLKRVGGAGVEGGSDRLVSPGWLKRYLVSPGSEVHQWVFGPAAPPAKGQAPAFSMAECLAAQVSLVRTADDAAEVRCAKGTRKATFRLGRFQGRWAITRDFFWPNELVNP